MRWSVLLVVAACGDGAHGKPDAAVTRDVAIDMPRDSGTPDADPNNPPTLMDTGLCADPACTQINAGISAYTPAFALWSDAASKRRWIQLPAGAQIDTTDPDHWDFPVGTKVWKEFTSQDGATPVRIETRFLWRQAMGTANDWFYVSYEWNSTQDATTAQPFGDPNANGTQHDIPPRFQCKLCHEGISSRVLGFGAIQLDHAAASGEIAIDDLVSAGRLTQNPPGATVPHYPLPGTGTATAAIGYLHANCGHCHNPQNTSLYVGQMVDMTLRLSTVQLATLAATPVYQTAVGHDATYPIDGFTKRIVAGDPAHSILTDRFGADPMNARHMPLIGSKVIDTTAQATIVDWITHIQ